MKTRKLYKHFISTNYANIKTKTNDFRKAKKQEKQTRNSGKESYDIPSPKIK
jgi:hypothetical protein